MRTTLILLITCSFVQVCAQSAVEKTPISLVDNFIFISVSVNEHEKPLNFLFDTGAGITVIHSKMAEQLKLEVTTESKIATSGKTLLSKESEGNTLKIGGSLLLDSVSLIFMDLSHISDYIKVEVDGVIGYDLLKNVITETNLDALEMRFYDREEFNPASTHEKLVWLESNLFGLPVDVTPKKGTDEILLVLQIDSGADNFLTFHNKTIREHGLMDSDRRYKSRQGFGADSTITSNLKSRVYGVTFAERTWKNVTVTLEVDPINHRTNSLADGLIGQRILNDFNITYDLKEGNVFFEKRK
ncbi:retropepsin-like aspartic protease [Fulvivirga sedimenti]|uniref:Retroviral-like aspartic protease family protein n=1 Tax=Fulvivirga sedimenti TaxID=2879465 RepID=A0A9X1HQ79_9BACT|nr:retropepsin-like aspartic protease [Fulvivirga sedimenti]MCA6074324.1 retroviral-like aspartic protease family protein [Fulvivirga sedimenti]